MDNSEIPDLGDVVLATLCNNVVWAHGIGSYSCTVLDTEGSSTLQKIIYWYCSRYKNKLS